jgi:hypothetical protein
MNMDKFYAAWRGIPDRLTALENKFGQFQQQLTSGAFNGANGRPGIDGRDGTAGQSGRDGAVGQPGPQENQGERGAAGRDGVNGQPGRDGICQRCQACGCVPENERVAALQREFADLKFMVQGMLDMSTKAQRYISWLKEQAAKRT